MSTDLGICNLEAESVSWTLQCFTDNSIPSRGFSSYNLCLPLEYAENSWFSTQEYWVIFNFNTGRLLCVPAGVILKGNYIKGKKVCLKIRGRRTENNNHVLMVQNFSDARKMSSEEFVMNVFGEVPFYLSISNRAAPPVSVHLNVPFPSTGKAVLVQEAWSIVGTVEENLHFTIMPKLANSTTLVVTIRKGTEKIDRVLFYNTVRNDVGKSVISRKSYKQCDPQLRNRHHKHHLNATKIAAKSGLRVEYGLCDPYLVHNGYPVNNSEIHRDQFWAASQQFYERTRVRSVCFQHYEAKYLKKITSDNDFREQSNRVILWKEKELGSAYYAFSATLSASSKNAVEANELIAVADVWLQDSVNWDKKIGFEVSGSGCVWIKVKDLLCKVFSRSAPGDVINSLQLAIEKDKPSGTNVDLLTLRCTAWATKWNRVFKVADVSDSSSKRKVCNTVLHPPSARFDKVNPLYLRDSHFTVFRHDKHEWFGECGMDTFMKQLEFV
jgi:hypothetical protein